MSIVPNADLEQVGVMIEMQKVKIQDVILFRI